MQSARVPSQQRRQEPVELQRHATERPRRNPETPPETQTNPNHQNTPDRPGSQALPTVHLPRVQAVSVGVRQESGRSCHLPNLPLRLPVRLFS